MLSATLMLNSRGSCGHAGVGAHVAGSVARQQKRDPEMLQGAAFTVLMPNS